jgi:hypothetical protein
MSPTRSAVSLRCSPIAKALEPLQVEALVPKTTVERLDVRIFDGLPGPDEVHIDPTEVGSDVEVVGCELGSVVHLHGPRSPALLDHTFESLGDRLRGKTLSRPQGQIFSGEAVDDREHSY